MRITELKDLVLQIGNLQKLVTLAIVDELDVPLLVSAAYQDKDIEAIQCMARRFKPTYSGSVFILDTFVPLVY